MPQFGAAAVADAPVDRQALTRRSVRKRNGRNSIVRRESLKTPDPSSRNTCMTSERTRKNTRGNWTGPGREGKVNNLKEVIRQRLLKPKVKPGRRGTWRSIIRSMRWRVDSLRGPATIRFM